MGVDIQPQPLKVRLDNRVVVDLVERAIAIDGNPAASMNEAEYLVITQILGSKDHSTTYGAVRTVRPMGIPQFANMLSGLRLKLGDRHGDPQVLIRRKDRVHLRAVVEIISETDGRAPSHILSVLASITNPAVSSAARRVLVAPDFPRTMAIGEVLAPNPAWRYDAEPPPPLIKLMHVDMFLVVRELPRTTPELYCYWSPRWDAFLLPFSDRERRGEQPLKEALTVMFSNGITNADRLEMRPLGKFLISVKRNQEHPAESWMYIFEFHSLVFPKGSEVISTTCGWHTLDRLSDPAHREAQVNADVIRALRDFGRVFEGLPRTEFKPA